MMLLRAAMQSVSGCPVAGSLVLPGSIGLILILRLPFPVMLLCMCVWVCDCVALFALCTWLQPVVQEVWRLYFPGLAACVS